MTETAPRYIPDTRFAAKLQELVNEHSIESLGQAKCSTGFCKDINALYLQEQRDLIEKLVDDLEAKSYEGRVEMAKLISARSPVQNLVLAQFFIEMQRQANELHSMIFEDFSGYWDTGNIDEVIPASRSFQRAKRECEATRLGI